MSPKECGPPRGCANDLGAPTSLVTVTARTNRAKADQGPAGWLPPLPGAHCRDVAE
ncbi:hypothetical protein [Streptomyces sp. KN37]|uniref:hypothetical protein n=1 Tax=Streptomyces sp. KN37 TaxID=3090667 RepID=UPI0039BE290B